MPAPDPRAPCIVGVGQLTVHSADPAATEPLDLWAEAVARAVADTGGRRVLDAVDRLGVVHCESWAYDDPPGRLAARLGIEPARRTYSPAGGIAPQTFLHQMAEAAWRGETGAALLVSGEALHTRADLRRAGTTPPWGHPDPAPVPQTLEGIVAPTEVAHGLLPVMRSFALRDVARRAHLGTPVAVHAAEPGELYAAMSGLAAANRAAWHRQAHRAEEVLAPTADNRMPVHPYTKFMMASPNVNQAAAVILATTAVADGLGVPVARRVYLRGWAAAADHPYVAANPDLWRSPAMAAAAAGALGGAGLALDDVAYFDLYSAFPAALRFACDALGRALDDPRGVTVTGGMPYAGAPGSGYVTQALCAMTEQLRADPGAAGVVSGLTAQMGAHVYSVFSTVPGPSGEGDPAMVAAAARVDPVPLAEVGRGRANILGYAVGCRRDGTDEMAVGVCALPDGRRCYATTTDPDLLAWLAWHEGVGTSVDLSAGDGGTNRLAL